MADIQIGHEVSKVDGLTVSSDGTTHKHVNFESRHINMKVSTYDSDDVSATKHKSRLIGVDSATDHSSQTQAEDWKKKIDNLLELYNQSPLSKRSAVTLKMAHFFAKLQGMNGDHANDQKKLAELLEEIKQFFFHQTLGEEKLFRMEINQLIQLLTKVKENKIEKIGGTAKWNALSEKEKLDADAECISHLVLELGREAYSQLSDVEKCRVDLFVWTGCAMHKDLNCVKGGNTSMRACWEDNNVPVPFYWPIVTMLLYYSKLRILMNLLLLSREHLNLHPVVVSS
jgi:hypothetical protein